MSKNGQKHQKTLKMRKCQKWGSPKWPPGAPKKKASLSNRRIGTRNTDSHMVSIQKGQKSTPIFRGCARPPKKGRIKAKLKFFFELFQKTAKNRYFWPNLTILTKKHHFWPFWALFDPPEALPVHWKNPKKHPFLTTFFIVNLTNFFLLSSGS